MRGITKNYVKYDTEDGEILLGCRGHALKMSGTQVEDHLANLEIGPRQCDLAFIHLELIEFAFFFFHVHFNPIFQRLFNLFWINGSWQKRLTAEDAKDRRGMLFFSAYSAVFQIVRKIIKSLISHTQHQAQRQGVSSDHINGTEGGR